MLSFNFPGHHLKIGEFKIIPIDTFVPIGDKGEGSVFNPLTRKVSQLVKHDSHSMKIVDFEMNPINTFNPISIKGDGYFLKLITRKVF